MLTTHIKNIQSSSVPLEKLIRDNEKSFLKEVSNFYKAHGLGSVYFNESGIKYSYVSRNGRYCCATCTWEQFDEWVFECDILGGD